MKKGDRPKALTGGTLRTVSPPDASPCIAGDDNDTTVRPEGLEPPTLGSEDHPAFRKTLRFRHL
jgi:hypothetical protein